MYPYRAENYELYIAQNRANYIHQFIDSKNDIILDYGCGKGLPWLNKKPGCLMVGMDIDEEAVAEARRSDIYFEVFTNELDVKESLMGSNINIVALLGVLEHIRYPEDVLMEVKNLFNPDKIYVVVPNGNSIHRIAGLLSHKIDSTTDLSEEDRRVGHQFYYTINSLIDVVSSSGYNIISSGSSHFKWMPNSDMDRDSIEHWRLMDAATRDIIHGIGVYHGAELWVIAEPNNREATN